MGRIIAYATPVFFAMIAIEYFVGRARGRNNYRLNDAVSSLSLGVMSQVVGLFTRALTIGIYAVVFGAVAVWQLPADQWWVWLLGIVSYDFCYYWNHRVRPRERGLLGVARRAPPEPALQPLDGAATDELERPARLDFLPADGDRRHPARSVRGRPVVNLLYQYWIHTEPIRSLGWFDRWFSSPSHHRVHHAVNDRYLDRNYGSILIVWDRLFGTFDEETERCVYGTRAPLDSWDPFWANFEVYADLARKSWKTDRWRDKLLVWLMPPGWQPAAASGAHWQKPHFEVSRLRRYDPPMTRGARWFTSVQFVAALLVPRRCSGTHSACISEVAAWSAAVLAVLWLTGAVMQGRLRVPAALAIEAAPLALLVVALPTRAESAVYVVELGDVRLARGAGSYRFRMPGMDGSTRACCVSRNGRRGPYPIQGKRQPTDTPRATGSAPTSELSSRSMFASSARSIHLKSAPHHQPVVQMQFRAEFGCGSHRATAVVVTQDRGFEIRFGVVHRAVHAGSCVGLDRAQCGQRMADGEHFGAVGAVPPHRDVPVIACGALALEDRIRDAPQPVGAASAGFRRRAVEQLSQRRWDNLDRGLLSGRGDGR